MDLHMRLLTEQDIPFGMCLKRLSGWNQSPEDWRRFLALSPDGCFLAELGGAAAGTSTTTPYGSRFGWVGMVLVLPEFRRRGIGTALLLHAIDFLEKAGVACVRLDATPLGKKLYDTLDFKDEYPLERMEGIAQGEAGGGGTELIAADLADVAAFDAPRFGADRAPMLHVLRNQAPAWCFLSRDSRGTVNGYLMARPGEHAFQIGPWVAGDPGTAAALFRRGLQALRGERVFLDVPLLRPEPARIVRDHGFTVQRPFIRMYRGELRDPGRPEDIYASCGAETG